jgi:dihydrofolate synthase/folylpolyglutamate synthase
MSYDFAVAKLYKLGHELARTPSHKFNLAHMHALLDALDNPERRYPSVLIAGTNGKGSTAATLASILRASGLRVGLYTSPHLIKLNERIRVEGHDIGDIEFATVHEQVERTADHLVRAHELPWHPSFFEMLTAIAFDHFARAQIEVAVLEVGMGGRLDATNVVHPLVAVITDIALDHQKFLGDTITQIAGEKAGIIRPYGVVVTLPQHPEANDVIGNAILANQARAVSAAPYVPPATPEVSPALTRYPVTVMGKEITVESPLLGRHQLRNVALAIATAEELSKHGFKISPEAIERGVRETRWPGRFQVVAAKDNMPEVVLDVAHNPAGVWALRSALSERYDGRDLTIVFGAMRDKAIGEMAEVLFPIAKHVVTTAAENPRSATAEEIAEAAARTSADIVPTADVPSALQKARELTGADGVIVITGSIYVVGEAMHELGITPAN